MSWADIVIPGGFVVIGWVLTARVLLRIQDQLKDARERLSRLEGKVNGMTKQ